MKCRVWLVTLVLCFAGASAVICSRKLARVQEAAERLAASTGQECLAVAVDVRKPETIVAGVASAMKKFGKIDILVNGERAVSCSVRLALFNMHGLVAGAAGNFLCPASALSFKAFRTVMEIDAHGTFNVIKAVFDACMKDHGGVVLNVTATLHYKGDRLQAHAGAAKAAIGTLLQTLVFVQAWCGSAGAARKVSEADVCPAPRAIRWLNAAPCKRLGCARHSSELRGTRTDCRHGRIP